MKTRRIRKSRNLTPEEKREYHADILKHKGLAKKEYSPFPGIIIIAIIGLVIYLMIKNRQSSHGTYQNTKKWFIKYNEDGMPTEITKVVNAKVV